MYVCMYSPMGQAVPPDKICLPPPTQNPRGNLCEIYTNTYGKSYGIALFPHIYKLVH